MERRWQKLIPFSASPLDPEKAVGRPGKILVHAQRYPHSGSSRNPDVSPSTFYLFGRKRVMVFPDKPTEQRKIVLN